MLQVRGLISSASMNSMLGLGVYTWAGSSLSGGRHAQASELGQQRDRHQVFMRSFFRFLPVLRAEAAFPFAIALRDDNRAGSVQGPARVTAPPDRPRRWERLPAPVAVGVDVSRVSGESVYGRVSRNGFVSQKRWSEGWIGRNASAVFEEPSVRTPPPWIGLERTRLLPSTTETQLCTRSR